MRCDWLHPTELTLESAFTLIEQYFCQILNSSTGGTMMTKTFSKMLFAASTVSALALVGFTTGCADSRTFDRAQIEGETRITATAAATLTITDSQGEPITGAKVMIGTRENVPFPGNVLMTDPNGQVQAPEAWKDAQPISIEAAGFVRTTYFATTAGNATLAVRKAIVPQKLELKGVTKGFGNLTKDGYMDVGMVFPALPRSAVNTFSVSSLVSPETDRLSVFGYDFDIPSNVSLPKQTENYVLPITLDKLEYRLYLPFHGTWKIVSTHVRFPFKDTVDGMRSGESMFDLVNNMDFRQASIKDFAIQKTTQNADLDVNVMTYQKSLAFQAPRYSAGFNLLAIALGEQGGLYFPTDVKKVAPQGKVTLATPKTGSGPALVVAALRRADAPVEGAGVEEMAAVTLPGNASIAYDFLPIVKAPALKQGTLVLDAPRATAGVDAVLTYAALNKVELISKGQMKIEQKTAQWDLYAPAWATNLTLPELPALPRKPNDKLRWEVMFGGQFAGSSSPAVGPAALESLSHITRSAVDL